MAIDKNKTLVEAAKTRLSKLSIKNVELLTGNMEKVVLPEIQFDTIIVCAAKLKEKEQLSHSSFHSTNHLKEQM